MVCMKDMRAILVNEDAGFIVKIECIAPDVVSFFNHKNLLVELRRKPFRKYRAGKTCSYD